MSFDKKLNDYIKSIEDFIDLYAIEKEISASKAGQAALYSLTAGGKRVRGVLCLAFAHMLSRAESKQVSENKPEKTEKPIKEAALLFAVALEMIHAFSLIHDDLPGMDDDDFRRGRPSCHKVYGEGMAILAGDALLNQAYQLILDKYVFAESPSAGSEAILLSLKILAEATGLRGMIGGQAIDIDSEKPTQDLAELTAMHSMKTGALMTAPVEIACVLAGLDDKTTDICLDYSRNLGLAFQIKDDILDVTATARQLGKTPGKDQEDGKSTFVKLLGLKGAKEELKNYTERAFSSLDTLNALGFETAFLKDLTSYLFSREK